MPNLRVAYVPALISELSTRVKGLIVALGRLRWVYASLANLRRGTPNAVGNLPFPTSVVTAARWAATLRGAGRDLVAPFGAIQFVTNVG